MDESYNEAVAAHYAAYRPPLHAPILKRVLSHAGRAEGGRADGGRAEAGLDIGCGTGRSSVALADFCEHVYAVDPSPAMLAAATSHGAITYLEGSAEQLPLSDGSIDLATFAGSLSYADFDGTVTELLRVCRPDALVVAYDFSVLMDEVLQPFGIPTDPPDSSYDHSAGFSGSAKFVEVVATQERMELDVRATDLAHVLLSDATRLEAFVRHYATPTPLNDLAEALGSGSPRTTLAADIYYSLYRLAAAAC